MLSPARRSPSAHRALGPGARSPWRRSVMDVEENETAMKMLAENEAELSGWFASRVNQVLGAVKAHQQMVRDMERREEVSKCRPRSHHLNGNRR